jgi:hypothetical protein
VRAEEAFFGQQRVMTATRSRGRRAVRGRAETRDDFALGYDALFKVRADRGHPPRGFSNWFEAGSLSKADDAIRCSTRWCSHTNARRARSRDRDCFVTSTVRPGAPWFCLLTLVLPEFRRSGVAAILRSVPVVVMHDADEILLRGRWTWRCRTRGTVVRLLACSALGSRDPADVLPYARPDHATCPTASL